MNSRATVRVLSHPDGSITAYMQLDVPAGALAALNGQPLGPNDSVMVTVSPRAGLYGFTISPTGLEFVNAFRPTATLFFARYGDFSVVAGSPTYASADAYAAALDIWRSVGIDRWEVAPSSRSSGTDQMSASIPEGGEFVLAAPR